MLLEQDNAALNMVLETANRICYVKRWSQYCHTGVAGGERSPHAYSSVKLPKIPTRAAGAKSSLESFTLVLLSQIACCPQTHRCQEGNGVSAAAAPEIPREGGTSFCTHVRLHVQSKKQEKGQLEWIKTWDRVLFGSEQSSEWLQGKRLCW